jgi:hypothetical protein
MSKIRQFLASGRLERPVFAGEGQFPATKGEKTDMWLAAFIFPLAVHHSRQERA